MNIRAILVFGLITLLPTFAKAQGSEPLAPQALISKLKWHCVGPYIGGRVVTVTGVPGKKNLFYAGTVGGGVWKSVDNGVEWKNITDPRWNAFLHKMGLADDQLKWSPVRRR